MLKVSIVCDIIFTTDIELHITMSFVSKLWDTMAGVDNNCNEKQSLEKDREKSFRNNSSVNK